MISMFSKYAKVFTLALALLIAAPVAISAAEETGSSPVSFGQNANRSFNGGGAPVRRKVKRKVRRKVRRRPHHNHAVVVDLTR